MGLSLWATVSLFIVTNSKETLKIHKSTLRVPVALHFDVVNACVATVAMATLDIDLYHRIVTLGIFQQHSIAIHVTTTKQNVIYTLLQADDIFHNIQYFAIFDDVTRRLNALGNSDFFDLAQ